MLERVAAYTAWRLNCDVEAFEDARAKKGSLIQVATNKPHPDLMESHAVRRGDWVHLLELGDMSILQYHASPDEGVLELLSRLDSKKITREDILATGLLKESGWEPFYYVDSQDFRPITSPCVRQLDLADSAAFARLQSSLPENMQWFVDMHHPVVFGYIEDGELIGAASNFLFDAQGVAATGEFVHPEHRNKGVGRKVVSAAVAWALERNFIVEYSTWDENKASQKVCEALGFVPYVCEREFSLVNPSGNL